MSQLLLGSNNRVLCTAFKDHLVFSDTFAPATGDSYTMWADGSGATNFEHIASFGGHGGGVQFLHFVSAPNDMPTMLAAVQDQKWCATAQGSNSLAHSIPQGMVVSLWDLVGTTTARPFSVSKPAAPNAVIRCATASPSTVCFSPCGNFLFATMKASLSTERVSMISAWDLRPEKRLAPASGAWSARCPLVASQLKPRFVDAFSGETRHSPSILTMVVAPCGGFLFLVLEDGALFRVAILHEEDKFSLGEEELLLELSSKMMPLRSMKLSADGRTLLLISRNDLLHFDVGTRTVVDGARPTRNFSSIRPRSTCRNDATLSSDGTLFSHATDSGAIETINLFFDIPLAPIKLAGFAAMSFLPPDEAAEEEHESSCQQQRLVAVTCASADSPLLGMHVFDPFDRDHDRQFRSSHFSRCEDDVVATSQHLMASTSNGGTVKLWMRVRGAVIAVEAIEHEQQQHQEHIVALEENSEDPASLRVVLGGGGGGGGAEKKRVMDVPLPGAVLTRM